MTTGKTSTASALATGAMALLVRPTHAAGPRFQRGSTYAEQVRELEGLGGDPSFLEPPTSWDGSIDESAYFGGWEQEAAPTAGAKIQPASVVALSYMERKKEIEAVGGDPSFLAESYPLSGWDGSIDDSAHFGGWES